MPCQCLTLLLLLLWLRLYYLFWISTPHGNTASRPERPLNLFYLSKDNSHILFNAHEDPVNPLSVAIGSLLFISIDGSDLLPTVILKCLYHGNVVVIYCKQRREDANMLLQDSLESILCKLRVKCY